MLTVFEVMKRIFLLLLFPGFSVLAQSVVPPAIPETNQNNSATPTVIPAPARPVSINGKPANELTKDEVIQFLQDKIKDSVQQEDGDLLPVHVAPGYAVTIQYQEPIIDVIPGDRELCSLTKVGDKILVINARQRAGDTNLSVVFPGGIVRHYHLFIEHDFATADDFYRILTATQTPETTVGGQGAGTSPSMFVDASGNVNGSNLTNLINNYDALVSERAVDTNRIRRHDLFRRGPGNAFTYYYIFQLGSDAAVTFRYRNPGAMQTVCNPGRIRLQIGAMVFRPDFASVDREYIGPGESAIGYVYFRNPTFSLNQPFDLVWSLPRR
jgi:hypothetical protein